MKEKKRHICGRRNHFARPMAWLLGTVILLAGCSGPGFFQKKPTAVSLAKTAVEKMQKAESVAVDMDLDASLDINYDQLNIGMKVDLDADVDMEMTRDPQLAKGSQIIELQMMGQNQEIRGRFYLDPADGAETTYMQWGDGKWMKKTSGRDDGTGEADSAATGSPGAADALKTLGLVKAIAEEAMRAELREETVTVNDKEAWQIDSTLTGEFLKTMLDSNSQNAGTGVTKAGPFDLTAVDWDAVEIPAQIFIYKDSRLPARIHLDCGTIGKELLRGLTEDTLGKLPLGSISLNADDCVVDLTFDRYDEIDAIEIPQEALEAEESKDLAPNLASLLGL